MPFVFILNMNSKINEALTVQSNTIKTLHQSTHDEIYNFAHQVYKDILGEADSKAFATVLEEKTKVLKTNLCKRKRDHERYSQMTLKDWVNKVSRKNIDTSCYGTITLLRYSKKTNSFVDCKTFMMNRTILYIGRDDNCDIKISNNSQVATVHAKIYIDSAGVAWIQNVSHNEGRVWIGKKNMTKSDEPTQLKTDMRFTIVNHHFRWKYPGESLAEIIEDVTVQPPKKKPRIEHLPKKKKQFNKNSDGRILLPCILRNNWGIKIKIESFGTGDLRKLMGSANYLRIGFKSSFKRLGRFFVNEVKEYKGKIVFEVRISEEINDKLEYIISNEPWLKNPKEEQETALEKYGEKPKRNGGSDKEYQQELNSYRTKLYNNGIFQTPSDVAFAAFRYEGKDRFKNITAKITASDWFGFNYPDIQNMYHKLYETAAVGTKPKTPQVVNNMSCLEQIPDDNTNDSDTETDEECTKTTRKLWSPSEITALIDFIKPYDMVGQRPVWNDRPPILKRRTVRACRSQVSKLRKSKKLPPKKINKVKF